MLRKLVLALTILSVTGSGFADSFADSPNLGRRDRGQRDQRDHRDDRGSRAAHPDRPYQPGARDEWRGRGAVPGYHRYNRGDRLPPEYRTRYYVVDDWRGHRLSPPPRGYHWVQNGSDYVLVAIATGIILQVLANH